jgi:hypothetical protein
MTHTIQQVLDLPDSVHATIRHNAYARVVRQYDFSQNFPATLRWFWGTQGLNADR